MYCDMCKAKKRDMCICSKVICWWSGGITSAVACKLAIDLYGKENCRVIMLDTKNEHEDTYRFKDDCATNFLNQHVRPSLLRGLDK